MLPNKKMKLEPDFRARLSLESITPFRKPQDFSTRDRLLAMESFRRSLPVYEYKLKFLHEIQNNQVLIVSAETGAGKTTQLPQYLVEAGYCREGKAIGCTQPRRVAAISIAGRVAEEMACKVGQRVGYTVRFDDCTTERTILKYMTDGMLLREFPNDPLLSRYSVIMIDEAHERTISTDILLGLLKDLLCERKDLKLIICSATLNADKFSKFFNGAPQLSIPGRMHKVDIMYSKTPETDYMSAAVTTVIYIHMHQPLPGDILVFLTGQEEIEAARDELLLHIGQQGRNMKELIVLPLYANLSPEEQAEVFKPCPENARKVILATNIAETSLTIDGIVYVVDTGFVKQKNFNPKTQIESLLVTPISQASCCQRSGRAGRQQPGKCYRLFTQAAYASEMEVGTPPEIQRSNLVAVVLQMLAMGIPNILEFDFIDPPPRDAIVAALELLYALGAINTKGELTETGEKMYWFPLDPLMSKAIIASQTYGCTQEILAICSMLSTGGEFFYKQKDKAEQIEARRRAFHSDEGDHLVLLRIWRDWAETDFDREWLSLNYLQRRTMDRARDIYKQLAGICGRHDFPLCSLGDDQGSTEMIRKALVAGYFQNVAKLDGSTYRTVKTRLPVAIHPSSCLYVDKKHASAKPKLGLGEEPEKIHIPRWLIYHELVFTTREYMRHAFEINGSWLSELVSHYYSEAETQDKTH